MNNTLQEDSDIPHTMVAVTAAPKLPMIPQQLPVPVQQQVLRKFSDLEDQLLICCYALYGGDFDAICAQNFFKDRSKQSLHSRFSATLRKKAMLGRKINAFSELRLDLIPDRAGKARREVELLYGITNVTEAEVRDMVKLLWQEVASEVGVPEVP